MKITCDNDHVAISYESIECPLCKAIVKYNDSESEAEGLRTSLNDKQDVIDALTTENEKQALELNRFTKLVEDLEKENDSLNEKIMDLETKHVEKKTE